MNRPTLRELREDYLLKLFELSEGNAYREISVVDLETQLESTTEQKLACFVQIGKRRWVEQTFGMMMLTPEGVEEAEKLMTVKYAATERRVLKAIRDMGVGQPQGWVMIDDLAKHLEIPFSELNPILIDLEDRKHFIGTVNEAVWILPTGLEELDGSARRAGGDIFHVHASENSTVAINRGDGNQNVNSFNSGSPEIDRLIENLVELVRASAVDAESRREISNEIQELKRLAAFEQSPQILDKAKLRISLLETAVKGTELMVKIAPYLPVLIKHFGG